MSAVLSNLSLLRSRPVVMLRDAPLQDHVLEGESDPAPSAQTGFSRIDHIALADMTLDDLHQFFHRAAGDAVASWNRSQGWLGRLLISLTSVHPGYAEVPGRVLKVARAAEERGWPKAMPLSWTYYLRGDEVLRYRDMFADLKRLAS